VILDTKWSIFGGFISVEWESRAWKGKYENDDNCPEMTFTLRVKDKNKAMRCDSKRCPGFGSISPGCDISVCNNCSTKNGSCTCFGNSYINNSGLRDRVVFTGSQRFTVEEIKVFEIMDSNKTYSKTEHREFCWRMNG
jgi:hypothetical protein